MIVIAKFPSITKKLYTAVNLKLLNGNTDKLVFIPLCNPSHFASLSQWVQLDIHTVTTQKILNEQML
jgi:hypothetical protein